MIGRRAVVCSLALAMAAASSGPAARAQVWEVGNRLLTAVPPADHEDFGYSLAAGDFDGDGMGDIAVGITEKYVDGIIEAGAVQILYGALFADGLESQGSSNWSGSAGL